MEKIYIKIIGFILIIIQINIIQAMIQKILIMMTIDIFLPKVIMIQANQKKDSITIANIWTKEKVVLKELFLVVFQEINSLKENTEVEVVVGVDLVEAKVEVGEKEVAIVDIGIEILQKERNHIQIQ